MHPPLFRPHPLCQEVVDAFLACHEENPYLKFLGACNDRKYALEVCLKQEKVERRRANAEKARQEKARIKAKMEELKQQGAY
mmetsp:Transcript_6591/g.7547  ORF Transcript_6591/g.7547 Transcript_6591/m.7547 type:complete len:82 (+) Transcript_6591:219-464(+)